MNKNHSPMRIEKMLNITQRKPFTYLLVIILLFLAVTDIARGRTLDSLRTEKVGRQTFVLHKVDKGETIYSISRRYNVETKNVLKANSNSNNLSIGQVLRIPVKNVSSISAISKTHKVAPGETLYSISKKYGINVDQLKRWNGLVNSNLSLGQVIKVSKPVSQKTDNVSTDFLIHKVRHGETFYAISKKYDVSVPQIQSWNRGISANDLHEGQQLRIKKEVKHPPVQNHLKNSRSKIYKEKGTVVASKNETFGNTFSECLHKKAKIGSIVEIVDQKSNKKVYAKVIGRLDRSDRSLAKINMVAHHKLGILPKAFSAAVTHIVTF